MTAQVLSKQQIDDNLSYYVDNKGSIAVVVYAIVKGSNVPLRMDIEAPAQVGLKDLFLGAIAKEIIENDDLSIIPLSSADERGNVIYHYDLQVPDGLACLNQALGQDGEQEFDFNVHKLDEIRVLLICIGNADRKIILYKTMAPVNIFSRDHFFLVKSDTRLKEIKDDFFRVSGNFQLMKINGEILVLDLALIEKMISFHEVIKKEATQGMEAIRDMNILSNIDVIRELIDDVKYARKLTRIAKSSPVIKAGIDNPGIIQFCKTYPILKGRIRFNEDETMISLDTKVSKDLFIKVLMDDFLTSQLTKFYYDSIAKDALISEAENA
ncbi:anti-phage protein KwaB [Pantoea agglomerans]|uniref:anti-phage protein KwaB n=1 Tax=Enterobacter agglomerans TaxID=549 RepID=UPI003C7C3881